MTIDFATCFSVSLFIESRQSFLMSAIPSVVKFTSVKSRNQFRLSRKRRIYSHQNIIIFCLNWACIHIFVSCGKLSKQCLVSHILRTTEFIDDWGWYGGNDDSSEMQTLFPSTRILRDYDINPWGNPSLGLILWRLLLMKSQA